jgi:hypothetical protein
MKIVRSVLVVVLVALAALAWISRAIASAAPCAPGGVLPSAVTASATSVSATTAVLRGSVDPRGCATTYRFEYGASSQYSSLTSIRSAGAGTTLVAVAVSIAGLTPKSVYHFRLVATSTTGSSSGNDAAFTTSPPPPSSVRIVGRNVSLTRGFIADVRLRCIGTSQPCSGALKLFRRHRLIGIQPFRLAADSTATVGVRLNQHGRKLMRHNRRLRVELVTRSTNNRARRFMALIRRFRIG